MGLTYSYRNSQTTLNLVWESTLMMSCRITVSCLRDKEFQIDLLWNTIPLPIGMKNGTQHCDNSEAVTCSSRQISQWSLHRTTPAERETASMTKFWGHPDPPQINCKLDQILNLMCKLTQTNPSLIGARFDAWEWSRDVLFHPNFSLTGIYGHPVVQKNHKFDHKFWILWAHVKNESSPTQRYQNCFYIQWLNADTVSTIATVQKRNMYNFSTHPVDYQ